MSTGLQGVIRSITQAMLAPSKTADLTTAKCLFNSVISTPNGRFMTVDLSDFYLESHLPPG